MPPPSRRLLAWHPDRMSIERRLGNLSRDPRCAPVRCARETAVRATRQRQWPLQLSLPKSTPRWRLLARISRYPGISSASRVKSVVRSNRPSIDRPAASTRAQFGGNGRSGCEIQSILSSAARRTGGWLHRKRARRRTKFGRAICRGTASRDSHGARREQDADDSSPAAGVVGQLPSPRRARRDGEREGDGRGGGGRFQIRRAGRGRQARTRRGLGRQVHRDGAGRIHLGAVRRLFQVALRPRGQGGQVQAGRQVEGARARSPKTIKT